MDSIEIQVVFFQHIKSLLPKNKSIVDEVADLLSIGNDSAYRRIRGETPIIMEEMKKLAQHYEISLDKFMNLRSDSFIFTGHLTNASNYVLEQWMNDTLQQLVFINSFKHRHLYYHARDIPHLYYFAIPEFWAFKSFVWKKSILLYKELKGAKFSMEQQIQESYPQLAHKIVHELNQIPTSEIWSIDCVNTALGQIEFYRSAHIFETKKDFDSVCQSFLLLIDHLEKQAESGLKSKFGQSPTQTGTPFNLYYNELSLGDNTAFVELDTAKITFLNHSGINFISTRDENFNGHIYKNLKNLIRKSTQLSEVGEKDRMSFFSRIREKIVALTRS